MTSNPTFASILNTGQSIIPIGARAFSINVLSGSAVINGNLYLAGQSLSWQAADAKLYLGASVAVGITGLANRTQVFYTT